MCSWRLTGSASSAATTTSAASISRTRSSSSWRGRASRSRTTAPRRTRGSSHERHELRRHRHEGPHHVAVLVLEDVAVVHVPAAVVREADGDLDDLVGIDPDRVLEPSLVLVDRVVELVLRVALERDGRGKVAFADAAVRDVVVDWPPRQDLERV